MMLALAGLGAGALHVVSGPDHLAALGPIAGRAPQRAMRLGALWGLGHGVGVLVMAAVARFVGSTADLTRFGIVAEITVGVMLVIVGVRALRRAETHAHLEGSAMGIGVLHGAAGAQHLLVVLPSVAMTTSDAAQYLGAYLLAAIGTMAVAGAMLGVGMRRSNERLRRGLRVTLAVAAIVVGAVWVGAQLI